MKAYPKETFRSFQEYDGYIKCALKLKLGDIVHFYCHQDDRGIFKPTTTKSAHTCKATVIAVGNSGRDRALREVVLGRKDLLVSFWDLHPEPFQDLHRIPNLDEFRVGWSVRFSYQNYMRDLLIAKIVKTHQ